MDVIFKLKKNLRKLYASYDRGNLSVRYIVALSLIAVLSIVLQIIVQYNLSHQRKAFETIQIARTNIDKIAPLKKNLFTLQSQTRKKQIKAEFDLLEQSFSSFAQEADSLWVDPIGQKETILLKNISPKEVKNISETFYLLNHKLEEIKAMGEGYNRTRSKIIFEMTDLLDQYQAFSKIELDRYEREQDRRMKKFTSFEYIILSLTLLTLLFEAIFIFKPALKKLEIALHARSDFFSRIGHEIRNPMNSILGMATLLEEHQLTRAQSIYLSRLKKSAQGLLHFLNNVIEYSGIEKNKSEINLDAVNIEDLLDQISSLFYFDASIKNLEFYFYVHQNVPRLIKTDHIKLRHIVFNLLGNAIKFTEVGSVTIGLEFNQQSQELILSVKDTGIGIDKDHQSHIFESFVQADSSVKRKYGGTGLGLSIVREYLDLLDGRIELDSRENAGSTFTIYLPIPHHSEILDNCLPNFKEIYVLGNQSLFDWVNYHKDAESKVIHVQTMPDLRNHQNCALFLEDSKLLKEASVSEHLRIYISKIKPDQNHEQIFNAQFIYPLISWHISKDIIELENSQENILKKKSNANVMVVDDSIDNCFILKSYLEKYFNNIDEVTSGMQCLDLAQKKSYDVIFLDIQMPEMDGHSVIKTMKQDKLYNNVVFVAFTAHNSSIEREKIDAAGFSYFLEKPLTMDKLEDILLSIFTLKKQQQEKTKNLSFEERIKEKMLRRRPEFIREKLSQLEEIEMLPIDQCLDKIKKFAHNLKGSATNYDYNNLSRLGVHLEKYSLEQNINEVGKLLSEVKSILSSEQENMH